MIDPKIPRFWALFLLFQLLLAGAGGAQQEASAEDSVRTKKGKLHHGQVVFESAEKLVLRDNSRLISFEQAELAEVSAVLRALPKALDKLKQLRDDDVAGHLALAAEMAAANLPHESRLLYWRTLLLDRNNTKAHTELGHRQVAGEWKGRAGNSWLKLPDLLRHHEPWSQAWEFETTHFEIRSNAPLRDVLRAAFDLEYTYLQFHRLFGEALELHASRLKIGAWIHADSKSYTDDNQGRGGYYREKDRRLHVDATQADWRNTLVHESVHGILDFAAAHTKSGSGRVPGWLHEALALIMEPHKRDGTYSPDPGAIGTSGPIQWLVETHRTAKKPFSLKKVLSMPWADFALDDKGDLRYAQAYTLAHFCLHAEGGKHRGAFFTYVRDALRGKASSTGFRKALGLRERALEKAWAGYVEQL